jgi:hypothetical protein
MPSAEVLAQIARSTAVNLNWLLLGDGQMQQISPDEEIDRKVMKRQQIIGIEIPSFVVKVLLKEATDENNETEYIPLYKTGKKRNKGI